MQVWKFVTAMWRSAKRFRAKNTFSKAVNLTYIKIYFCDLYLIFHLNQMDGVENASDIPLNYQDVKLDWSDK